ncbi:hypothetical protein ONZ43_g1732 [Nemania bipapillata]|uniref:Uncharacterized protein n=1 Tax=Nemania bipapillata TaxID=110536 RepID=A0ACC2J388_9PEZI|nr:hypothetical protein ONZ43_g1732 [Nemania bipapillata]
MNIAIISGFDQLLEEQKQEAVIVLCTIAEFGGALTAGHRILGYALSGIVNEFSKGTKVHALMVRESKAFSLTAAEKSSERHEGELFRHYVSAIVISPRSWFGPFRFTLTTALACNDVDDAWALDVDYARRPEGAPLMNMARFIGGPIHLTMRRYRFVEDDLTISKPETTEAVE